MLRYNISRSLVSLERGKLRRLRTQLPHRIQRPVFIIAPGRSGSTFLFESLAKTGEFSTFTHREAEHIWWRVIPFQDRSTFSDLVEPHELGPRQRDQLRAFFYTEASRSEHQRGNIALSPRRRLGLTPIRYLDKTISNSFRLPVIAEIFPDATFVFLFRDPRPTIASMIEGWPNKQRFAKDDLDGVAQGLRKGVTHWSFQTPPGWQEVLDQPLAEICAWSWDQCVQSMLNFRDERHEHVLTVHYEQLLSEPEHCATMVSSHLGLSSSEALAKQLRTAPPSRTTVSAPTQEKWRSRASELEGTIPMIRETAYRAGYDLMPRAMGIGDGR